MEMYPNNNENTGFTPPLSPTVEEHNPYPTTPSDPIYGSTEFSGGGYSVPPAPKKSSTKIIILLSVLIVVVLIGGIGIVSYIKSEKAARQSAAERVDSICQELYDIESFDSSDDYDSAAQKLEEASSLISEYDFIEKTDVFEDVKLYINDLNTFRYITEDIYSTNKSTLTQVNNQINSLTHQNVIAKLSDYYSVLENHAYNIVWNNLAVDCQQKVISDGGSSISGTYIYDESRGASSYSSSGRRYFSAPGITNRVYSGDADYTYFSSKSDSIPSDAWDKITSNGKKALIIMHKNGSSDWVNWWYVGLNIDVTYEDGQLVYKTTIYTKGTPKPTEALTFDKLLKKSI